MILSFMLASALGLTPPAPLLIRDAVVISPQADAPRPDTDILVLDGVITAIGSEIPAPADAVVLDAEGRYVIPGLIDSHVHLYHATGMRRGLVSAERARALRRAYAEQLPRSLLYWGFTTVIELNADMATNAAFEARPLHPHLLHCGQGVILADGYMALEIGGATDYPAILHDPDGGDALPAHAAPEDHTPDAVLDRLVQSGAICVKLYYEEAHWWLDAPRFSLPSLSILQDVQRAAEARGLTTLLHATAPDGHQIGLAAGIDVMAHGLWELPDHPYDAPTIPAAVQWLLDEQAHAGQAIQPTLQTLRNTASMFDPQALNDPGLNHALPAEYLTFLRTEAQAQRDHFLLRFASLLDPGQGPDDIARLQSAFNARYERQTGALSAAGARLLFGTDTAVGGFGWGNPPGLNGYREMQGWVRGGVSLRALFEALTLDNAEAFGLAGFIGSVEPGKRADLLILNANPLETVEAYDQIEWVILEGRPIPRAVLSATRLKGG